ncbi:MAG: hypothetical protein V1662_06585 [Candidatus Omnitrophota bacterium]
MKALSLKVKVIIITLVFLAGVSGINAETGLADSSLAGESNTPISVSEENASCVGVETFNVTYTLEDASSKQLSVFVWYPITALGSLDLAQCPCPLIILSHGFGGGTPLHFTHLTENLVKQGYIVAATIHEDSVYYPGLTNFFPNGFWDRPLDVKAIIDQMLRLNNDWESILYGTIDEEAIGILGHSLGGWTAEVLCGATPAVHEDCTDPRIKAAVFFAPANMFLHTTGIGSIQVPSMSIFGANDKIVITSLNKFVYEQAASPKYYAVIKDFGHSDYGDSGEDKPEADILRQYTLSFFDRYLKDNFSAGETLQTSSPIFSAYEYADSATASLNLRSGLTKNSTGNKGNLFGGLIGGGNPLPVPLQATAFADDPSALDSPWQEVPAYGTELEAIAAGQETAASGNTADNNTDETSNDTSSEVVDNSNTGGLGNLLNGLLGGGGTGGMGNLLSGLMGGGNPLSGLMGGNSGTSGTNNLIGGPSTSSNPMQSALYAMTRTFQSGTRQAMGLPSQPPADGIQIVEFGSLIAQRTLGMPLTDVDGRPIDEELFNSTLQNDPFRKLMWDYTAVLSGR